MKKLWGGLLLLSSMLCFFTGCKAMPEHANREMPTIVVGSDIYPPYIYQDSDGAMTGIDVDIAKEAFRRIGYHVEFSVLPLNNKLLMNPKNHVNSILIIVN